MWSRPLACDFTFSAACWRRDGRPLPAENLLSDERHVRQPGPRFRQNSALRINAAVSRATKSAGGNGAPAWPWGKFISFPTIA